MRCRYGTACGSKRVSEATKSLSMGTKFGDESYPLANASGFVPMPRFIFISRRTLQLLLAACCALSCQISAQSQNAPAQQQTDEVIRVNTELVQTDVMVFDKKGRFVDGLRPAEFKLSLDGQ